MKKPITVTSFSRLRHWLEPRLHGIRLVSFDVFDTLLARCVEPPDTIQRRVAGLLAERIGGISPQDAYAVRTSVESDLRRQALSDGMDHECHFDPLVEAWVTRLNGTPDPGLVEFVHASERELESLALVAKPQALAFLKWLRQHDIRIIAVSDMYLSHDHIAALLHGCGLAGLIDQLYVSSEFGLGKYSGRLHAKVLELEGKVREGLTPAEVVHVGDNLVSDMKAPMQLGMRGIYLDERAERLRRRRQNLSAEMAVSGGVWPGRRFFEMIDFSMQHDLECQAACQDFFHHYGAHVLGPVFSAFMLGLAERIDVVKPDKLFFLARDGYLFEKMYRHWRELRSDVDHWPEPVYVYASRRVVASASVADGLTPEQAIVAFYNPKQQGLQSVLKTFGLPKEDFVDLAREHGFADIGEPIHDWQDGRLLAFLNDDRVQSLIRPIGQNARDLLQRYFEQQGFFSCQRAVLVDIGWNGTIQKFLRDSFGERTDFPDLHGWYFAFVAAMHGDFGMGDRISGFMLDARRGDPFERIPMDFEEIFEQGARSGEGTTLGYCEVEGIVVPILKDDSVPDRQGEIACNPLIERFQAGVIDHLDHFHVAWRLSGYTFADIKPYVLALLERAVAYPTREEVSEIGRLVHTEDFGHDHTLDIAIPPVGYMDFLRPRRLYRKLQPFPWKFAAFARFRIALPAWLFRWVYLMRKGRG